MSAAKCKVTCKQMIEKYLTDNDYDGLAGEECGCALADGLFPCMNDMPLDCVAGYQRKATKRDCEFGECNPGDWIIVGGRRPRKLAKLSSTRPCQEIP